MRKCKKVMKRDKKHTIQGCSTHLSLICHKEGEEIRVLEFQDST